MQLIDIKIMFLKPDVAAVDVRWEMTSAKNQEGQDIPLRMGLLNFVMTKLGRQVVHHSHCTTGFALNALTHNSRSFDIQSNFD